MNRFRSPLRTHPVFIVALIFVLAGSACTALPFTQANAPTAQPVLLTQVVTQMVTQDITQEVTRVIEVPVTVAPSATPLASPTPALTATLSGTPAPTPTPEPPVVSILEYSDCLYGPASFYLYKTSLQAGSLMEAVGRSQDGTWLLVQAVHGWNPCWIQVERVKFNSGDFKDLAQVYSAPPLSTQFAPPQDAIARRNGSEVTVTWTAMRMSFDDYRGYLIEAWVCQGGTQIFLPVSYVPPLEGNTGKLSVKITDEPGCDQPSHARIYSADKYGYSVWQFIFWPPN